MKLSRRAFSLTLASTAAVASAQDAAPSSSPLALPAWDAPSTGGDAFAFPMPPSPRTRWNVPGPPRRYFAEWLPARR
ncbi:MAG: hypothetical protein KGN36_19015, partial [Acidobacteriota bacterium]|nr:hypothetical protein [Acidobacteriota bacterium]